MGITLRNKRPLAFMILALVFMIGAFLRLYDLPSQPYWMDEGYTVNAVLAIEERGAPILDSGETYSCPLYCYPAAYTAKFLGDSALAYRLPAALFGILFVGALFFIVRRLFSPSIALVSVFFATFSYWQIAWSRQARWYTLFELFFWLALYFFYQTLYASAHRKRFALLTAIFTTLAILTHGLGYLLPFIFFAWFLIDQIFFHKTISVKQLVVATGSLGTLIILLAYAFNIELFVALLGAVHFSYELPYYLSFYLREYWFFILLSFLAFNITDTPHRRAMWYLVFVLLAYLAPLAFLTNIVHYRYLFHATPVLFVLSAVALAALADSLPRRAHKIALAGATLAIFFTVGGGVLIPQSAYYLESDNPETLGDRPHYAYTPQPNWNAAYDHIRTNRTAGDIVISSHPHFTKIFLDEAGYWIQYDYLGVTKKPDTVHDGKEYYVGAQVIPDLAALQDLTATAHGYLVFDYMATDGRFPPEILAYITENMQEVFTETTNPFSRIWVYKF